VPVPGLVALVPEVPVPSPDVPASGAPTPLPGLTVAANTRVEEEAASRPLSTKAVKGNLLIIDAPFL
jgi:hypothetical protein